MDEREAFLKAIRDDPDSDTPRLVFADWLEEHGDGPRAEFIRVQCELARTPEYDPRYLELEDRQDDLLAVHEEEWLGDLPDTLQAWRFERGFLEWVCPDQGNPREPAATLEGFDRLFARHPIRSASLAVWSPGDATRLADSPWLGRIRDLTVVDRLPGPGSDPCSHLVMSPRLTGLRSLNLSGTAGGGDQCLEAVARQPWASGLEMMGLTGLTDIGLARLLNMSCLARVTALSLMGDGLTAAAVARLVSRCPAAKWKALEFGKNEWPASSLNRLRAYEGLERLGCTWPEGHRKPLALPPTLTSLEFRPRGGGPPVEALTSLDCLPRLRNLSTAIGDQQHGGLSSPEDRSGAMSDLLARLSGPVLHVGVWGQGLTDLLGQPHLDRVRTLGVCGVRILSDDVVRLLVGTPGPSKLRRLIFSRTWLSVEEMSRIVQAPALEGLRSLDMRYAGLDGAAVSALLTGRRFPRLTSLNLSGNSPGESGVRALLDWPGLSQLRSLDLRGEVLPIQAVALLLSDPRLNRLTRVSLTLPWAVDHHADRAPLGPLVDRFGCRLIV